MTTIRIALLDADPVIAAGKRSILDSQPDFMVVYEQGDALLAIVELPEQLVDVVVMDVRLRGLDGLVTASRLTSAFAESNQLSPKFVITAAYRSQELEVKAREVGITSLVSAAELGEKLVDSVRGSLS